MATQKGSGLISRAVREALSTLVSPQICEQLIARSLASHGLDDIPESGSQVGDWLENGLKAEVETAVGPDAADLMMSQLGPIAAYAAISKPRAAVVAPAPAPEPVSRISSLPSAPGARGPRLPKEPPPAFGFDDDDEPDRPTALRPDAHEPDWQPDRVTAVRLDAEPHAWDAPASLPPVPHAYHSGPPTGLYRDGNQTFSPMPPANGNAWSDADMNVRTLPPAQPVSDRSAPDLIYTTRPQEMDELGGEASGPVPVVLTATSDQRDLDALARYLSASAQVIHIPDLVGLLDVLEDKAMVEPIVLIDCQRPTLHITSVSALGEDLPKGTTVVLWGVDDHTWSQIDRDKSPTCRWVRCSREATTDDVGSLCSMLIG